MANISLQVFLVVGFSIIGTIKCLAVTQNNLNNAYRYLSKFGYVDSNHASSQTIITESSMEKIILKFQNFAGLEETGILDDETLKWMRKPRCGVKDNVGLGADARRKKRYALQGSRWRINKLTYRLNNLPKTLKNKEAVDEVMRKSFKVWSDVTNLEFIEGKENTKKVHIDMSFETKEHGDGDPFDGEGGTLAHAFFPVYGGDVHIDDMEYWSIDSYSGTDLFQVVAHELGHSLGLSHSDSRSALMAPFYGGYQPDFELDKDDIQAIQVLYGEKKKSPQPKPETPPKKPSEEDEDTMKDEFLCKNPKMDGIARIGEMDCVFKGSKYWKVLAKGLAKGFPREVKDDFKASFKTPGGEDPLKNFHNFDAIFSWKKKNYFFKGEIYWRFTLFDLDPDFPKKISEEFSPNIPPNIDTAFIWSGNDKLYFFKGSQYWKYDHKKNPPVSPKLYPRPIKNWKIPNNIDAAFVYKGATFFFKDDKYWRFNDFSFKLATSMTDPYPRSITKWWYNCTVSGLKVAARG